MREQRTRVDAEMNRLLEHLRFILSRSHKTHREVAKEIGLGHGGFALVLSGDRKLKYWVLLAILDAVDVTPRDFFQELYGDPRPEGGPT